MLELGVSQWKEVWEFLGSACLHQQEAWSEEVFLHLHQPGACFGQVLVWYWVEGWVWLPGWKVCWGLALPWKEVWRERVWVPGRKAWAALESRSWHLILLYWPL